MIWGKLLGRASWFLLSRVALLGICVAIPVGLGWALGWFCS